MTLGYATLTVTQKLSTVLNGTPSFHLSTLTWSLTIGSALTIATTAWVPSMLAAGRTWCLSLTMALQASSPLCWSSPCPSLRPKSTLWSWFRKNSFIQLAITPLNWFCAQSLHQIQNSNLYNRTKSSRCKGCGRVKWKAWPYLVD